MPNPNARHFLGVIVSSTFSDLKAHRKIVLDALASMKLMGIAMEHDSAKADADLISSSLEMVREAAAYILIIGHKYGQTPVDERRNPEKLSITELEFNAAQALGLPTLLFIMGDDHPVKRADVEPDPGKRDRLAAFRERAKLPAGSQVSRIYAQFNSVDEFTKEVYQSVGELANPLKPIDSGKSRRDPIPLPPDLYAEPHYLGSHEFVGRATQLFELNHWASPTDNHSLLLFDAIGGTGKSMLTWHWFNDQAVNVRKKWAGGFWYSFYERGAIMADFCRHALAYMTRQPLDSFLELRTPELSSRLLRQLHDDAWLLVLDGIERILVNYQRIDAAEIEDGAADDPTYHIAKRDPCAAIRHEDDDLLRELAAAGPSKILVTSRLVPRVLLNHASQTIPGAFRVTLPGLRPADAEALIRSCGVTGASQAIQDFLKTNCDCHPLVTGALAGLINEYLPARGDFDRWFADPVGGAGRLNLADLDLRQRRKHILKTSFAELSDKSRELLSTLALLSTAGDDMTIAALNPHLRPDLDEDSAREGQNLLAQTVFDLKSRGLLQYDTNSKKYDLHPVVRGVVAGSLTPEETNLFGQLVLDHLSRQPHDPYEGARSLEDVQIGLHIVRVLLKMGRYKEACKAYRGDLEAGLLVNLESYPEVLTLLRPFFPMGWAHLPKGVCRYDASSLLNSVTVALSNTGALTDSLGCSAVLIGNVIRCKDWAGLSISLSNLGACLRNQNRLAQSNRCRDLNLSVAELMGGSADIFRARLECFGTSSLLGEWEKAEKLWNLLDTMGRDWGRATYRLGNAEQWYARFLFWQGRLSEEGLLRTELLASEGKDRKIIRSLHNLRGQWHVKRSEWEPAANSFGEAVAMDRHVAQIEPDAEMRLTLAKFHLGQLHSPRQEAERLSKADRGDHQALAELWLAIGDRERAKQHALKAHKGACADGEPYVLRYSLDEACALLKALGVDIPPTPIYDPIKDGKFPMEDEVIAVVEQLRREKAGSRINPGVTR